MSTDRRRLVGFTAGSAVPGSRRQDTTMADKPCFLPEEPTRVHPLEQKRRGSA